MTVVSIPESFAQCMREVYAAEGEAWIAGLPALLAGCEERWGIVLEAPFALSYNYVAPARRQDGTGVVLKAGYPCPELRNEMEALRLFDGRGINALLESDAELGLMLLERLAPGESLVEVEDVGATSTAAQVMRQLWIPAPNEHTFPTVADWGKGFQRLRAAFGGGAGPFPEALVAEAEELFASLLASAGPPMLLHGDLHHGNILSAARASWLAIDPKGLVGEREYEVGAFLRNPSPGLTERPFTAWPGAARITARRIAQFGEEPGMDRQRIRGWGFAQAVLSAWWTYEDHGRVDDYALEVARLIRGV